jgi:uncharacterized Zn finger protein
VALVGASPPAKARAAASEAPAVEPLPATADAFWRGSGLPDDLFGRVEPPTVTAALLGRLGPFPFWRGREPLFKVLTPVYQAASSRGLDVLLEGAAARDAPTRKGPPAPLML